MDVTALEKAPGTQTKERPSNIVDFTPRHKEHLVANVVQETQKVEPSFKEEDATSHASEPVPNSPALTEVKAERTGVEPDIKWADVTHAMGSTIQEALGGTSDTIHVRTTKGETPLMMLKRKLFGKAA